MTNQQIKPEEREWNKATGNSDAWWFTDTQKRSDAVERIADENPTYPIELRSWRACSASQRVLGTIPTGITDESNGVTLFVSSRKSNDISPWRRFHFPCIMLSSATPSLKVEHVPVPFQMCVVAYNWMQHQSLTQDDVADWRTTKYKWVIRCQPALRHLFTGKKRHLDTKRFGLKYMASDHCIGPIEAALVKWIHECGGPRLIIPPSYRDPTWALVRDIDERDRVDAFRYLFPEIDQEVDLWAQNSQWQGLITRKSKLDLL